MYLNKKGFTKRVKSFGYAFAGLYQLINNEPNARIHLGATIVALVVSVFFRISNTEWCIILIVIALVWITEAFNTVIENLSDHLFPEYHRTARIAKDVSAGAVLICAIIALACGLIIFLPKLFLLFT